MRFKVGEDKPSLILGTKFAPGKDNLHFCKPTDVAVLSTGEFFVSDGYCNSRIMKFSKEGKLIKQWGNSLKSSEGRSYIFFALGQKDLTLPMLRLPSSEAQ